MNFKFQSVNNVCLSSILVYPPSTAICSSTRMFLQTSFLDILWFLALIFKEFWDSTLKQATTKAFPIFSSLSLQSLSTIQLL